MDIGRSLGEALQEKNVEEDARPGRNRASSSRILLIVGGGVILGLTIAALIGVVFFSLDWSSVEGIYQFLKDLYLYFVGAYGVNQAGRVGQSMAKFKMEPPVE